MKSLLMNCGKAAAVPTVYSLSKRSKPRKSNTDNIKSKKKKSTYVRRLVILLTNKNENFLDYSL